MSVRVTLCIKKVLSEKDGVREMEELRTFLSSRGFDIVDEASDQVEERTVIFGPVVVADSPKVAPVQLVRCPHCRGVGRSGGLPTPCPLCFGGGKVAEGVRHEGRCCT